MNEDDLRRAMAAVAGPPPDVDAAWAKVAGRADRPARRWPAAAVAAVAAAALLVVAVALLQREGDDGSVVVVPPEVTTTTTTTTPVPTEPSVTEVPLPLPATPLVVATGPELQLWDGDEPTLVGTLTTAGHGRPVIAESYRITEVSLGAGVVVFTEEAGPEDEPSIWRLDLATGLREQLVPLGRLPAISPDGSRLAYLRGGLLGGVAQEVGIIDLTTRAEQVLGGDPDIPFGMDLDTLAWSPDGTRLLIEDAYEYSYSWVLDPTAATLVTDGIDLAESLFSPAWVDDETVVGERRCCYAEDGDRERRYVEVDARTGAERRTIGGLPQDVASSAVTPDGRIAVATVDDPERPVQRTVHLPGGTTIEGVRDFDW